MGLWRSQQGLAVHVMQQQLRRHTSRQVRSGSSKLNLAISYVRPEFSFMSS